MASKIKLILILFIFAVVSISCNRVPPKVPPTTKQLNTKTTQQLSIVENNGEKLIFNTKTSQLESLSSDDVVVVGVTDKTPYGLLRKVTALAEQDGQIIVETQPATLEDAIEQADINVSKDLTQEINTANPLKPGVSIQNMQPMAGGSFFINMDNVVLYDADGDEDTTDDQIKANGSIALQPSFEFNAQIRDYKLQSLIFKNTTIETAEIGISAEVDLLSFKKEISIAKYTFSPIPVPVGPVTVVLVPILTVNVGIDGSVSIGISTGVTQEATLTVGLEFEDGNWGTINDFTNEFKFKEPNIDMPVSVKAYTGPQLNIMIYGVVGPYSEINGYLKLAIEQSSLNLYGGLFAKAGVSLEVLSHVIAGYEADLIDAKKLLYSKSIGGTTSTSVLSTTTTKPSSTTTANPTINPTIAQSPMSGPAGTTFVQWGTGFTPNSSATLYFPKHDGVNDSSMQTSIDSIGHFEISYPSGTNKPPGSYSWYAIDGPTGKKSNTVTYTITSSSSTTSTTNIPCSAVGSYSYSGTLESSDGRSIRSSAPYYTDLYTFTLCTTTQVQISMTSTFNGNQIFLFGGSIPTDASYKGYVLNGNFLNEELPPGTYCIEVTSTASSTTGDYVLTSTVNLTESKVPDPYIYSGTLESSDGRSIRSSAPYYTDLYTFTLSTTTRVQIWMNSTFNGNQIFLFGGSIPTDASYKGYVLNGNLINEELPPGTYCIEVTSTASSTTGDYVLTSTVNLTQVPY
jgi:hypothetical protein